MTFSLLLCHHLYNFYNWKLFNHLLMYNAFEYYFWIPWPKCFQNMVSDFVHHFFKWSKHRFYNFFSPVFDISVLILHHCQYNFLNWQLLSHFLTYNAFECYLRPKSFQIIVSDFIHHFGSGKKMDLKKYFLTAGT